MKSNNILSYLLILFMILGVSSCKDDEPTSTNNNSNKSGAILTLEYNGETETHILDYLHLESITCYSPGRFFEFPMLICEQLPNIILDIHMHESNYPIRTGNYKSKASVNGLGLGNCGDLKGNDKDIYYAELIKPGGFFGFNDFGIQFISDEGDFNISSVSSDKISFEYEGKFLIYNSFKGEVLGTINVTFTGDNISYDDEY